MIHSIRNQYIEVRINETGAELAAITGADGTEYLWSGDEAYWKGRAPNLFPYVGRLTGGAYTIGGVRFEMGRHGFARHMGFYTDRRGPEAVSMSLRSNEETLKHYPRQFIFRVDYALENTTLAVTYSVENQDSRPMYFGLGAHPGFRVPLEPGKKFEDYRLTFAHTCQPWQVMMSDEYMINGREEPYPLEAGTVMPLRHGLFDHDAVILKNMDRTVTLSAGEGTKGVRLEIPRMRYLGVWHMPETDAPFVCLEPWMSLPSRQGVVEEFSQQSDLLALEPGERYENRWSISVF